MTARKLKFADPKLPKKPFGLTLIEMVMVFSLVALVLGIFVVRTAGLNDQKRIETARGDLRALETAVHAYYLNHSNVYPSGSDWQTNDLQSENPRVTGQVLFDPFASSSGEYLFSTSANGSYYVIYSIGPNRTANITGINNNGLLTGVNADDIFVTNGTSAFA